MKIRFRNSPALCEAGEGETLLSAFARGGIVLSAPCGGRGRCGKCKVRLLEGTVSGDSPDSDGYVRACLARPLSDLLVVHPGSGALVSGGADMISVSSVTPGKTPFRAGVAFDIGTTTVSARLLDLDGAVPVDTVSELNDQRVFGADVMSRIGAARNGKTAELFALINRQTERILSRFREKWGLGEIEKLSVSGNTVMLHLFLNVDPSSMGELPFTPVFLEERRLSGAALSLSVREVMALPSISAFVGADITAGLAALDILNGNDPSLLVDIGTNGEMVLFKPAGRDTESGGTLLCCSTAAGPAFEGAEISCGMGGVSGAVSGVELTAGGVSLTTIGNAPPRGICGSGLIDAMALMLRQGIVDETGLMENCPEAGFVLAEGVALTQRDVRQFQLAKSAILSGIRILCKNGGLLPEEIKNVYIAGGFGFFVNRKNAVGTGLFPKEFLERVTVSGNLSLAGAEASLLENDFSERCARIVKNCSSVDLAGDPSFMDEFAENMLFESSL